MFRFLPSVAWSLKTLDRSFFPSCTSNMLLAAAQATRLSSRHSSLRTRVPLTCAKRNLGLVSSAPT